MCISPWPQRTIWFEIAILNEGQRGVFVDQLAQRGGELDLVLALSHRNGKAVNRLWRHGSFDRKRACLFARDRRSGREALKLAESHCFAQVAGAALLDLRSDHRKDARCLLFAIRRIDRTAVRKLSGEHPRQRELARVRGVIGLHDVGCRFGAAEAQALGRLLREGHLVPERLEQPRDSVAFLGRAEKDRDDLTLLELDNEILEDLVPARRDVAQKLLHQVVVVVGELFEHGKTLIGLELREVGWNGDHLARRMLAIDESALESQVHESAHDPVFPDRKLPEHKREAARRLHHCQDFIDALASLVQANLVNLIDEEEMGDACGLKTLQNDLKGVQLFLVGFADHDGGVAGGYGAHAVILKLDRTRTVEHRELVAKKLEIRDVHLDTHAVALRLGRCVAGQLPLIGGLVRRARADQYRFEKGCLAAWMGTNQCDTAGTSALRISISAHVAVPYAEYLLF